MDEILELQKTLAAVQLEDTTYRLSERNCIEIVMKLKELGMIEIFYTTNGKEYLTPKQLRLEIEDELTSSGGRVQLSDLQPIINVDSLLIERIATQYAEEDDEVMLIAGELVTEWHLDRLCVELNEELHGGEGLCTIGQLASRFNLPVSVVQQMVEKRIGSILKATYKGGLIYTEVYERKQTAKIRGVLSAITRPISIPQIASFYGFEDNVVEITLKKLIKEGRVAGHLRGREWAPSVFTRAQRTCVDDFFAQNGYLEYTRAQNLKVPKPGQFVKLSYPDALDLHDTVISQNIVSNLEANLEETIRTKSWAEAGAFLPPVLSVSDVGLLVNRVCKGRKGDVVALADQYMASMGFVNDCIEKFQEPAEAKAHAVAKERKPALAKSISSSSALEEDFVVVNAEPSRADESSKKKGRKGNKKGKRGKRGDDSSDEDAPTPQPMPSKKDKKKDKRKGKSGRSSLQQTVQATPEEHIALDEVEQQLLDWFPEIEDHPELSLALSEHVLRRVQALYDEKIAAALSSIHHGDTAERRKRQRLFESEFETRYTDLQLFVKGFQIATAGLDKMHPQYEAIQDHILTTYCLNFAEFVTSHICFLNQVYFRDPKESKEDQKSSEKEQEECTSVGPLSPSEKERLQEELSKDVWQGIKGLWTLVTGPKRSLELFLEHNEANTLPYCDVIPRKLDKKKERQILFGKRHDMVAHLTVCGLTLEALKISLCLLFQQVHNAIVPLPLDLNVLSTFLESISNKLSESKYECCVQFKNMLMLDSVTNDGEESNIDQEGVALSDEGKNDLLEQLKKISITKKAEEK